MLAVVTLILSSILSGVIGAGLMYIYIFKRWM